MSDDIADALAEQEEKAWGSPVDGDGRQDDMAADADIDLQDARREAAEDIQGDREYYADMWSAEQEAREDEEGAQWGDPRRCHRHGTIISSADGMFDGVCGACEGEMDAHSDYDDWKEALVASGPTCTDNGFKLDTYNDRNGRGGSTCQDWNWCRPLCLTGNEVSDPDSIPF